MPIHIKKASANFTYSNPWYRTCCTQPAFPKASLSTLCTKGRGLGEALP